MVLQFSKDARVGFENQVRCSVQLDFRVAKGGQLKEREGWTTGGWDSVFYI